LETVLAFYPKPWSPVWIRGNLAIEFRFANFRAGLMTEAAGDLVRLNMNVIFAAAPEALAAVRNATNSVPVVAADLEPGKNSKTHGAEVAFVTSVKSTVLFDVTPLSVGYAVSRTVRVGGQGTMKGSSCTYLRRAAYAKL
jgi:hypothetical protein